MSLKRRPSGKADDEVLAIIKDLKAGKADAKDRLYKYVKEQNEKGVSFCDSFFETLGVEPPKLL